MHVFLFLPKKHGRIVSKQINEQALKFEGNLHDEKIKKFMFTPQGTDPSKKKVLNMFKAV